MHKFLRAVGFSQYTEKKQVQKLIRDIIIHADERSYTTVGKKTLVAEFDRNFAEDIGIAVCGRRYVQFRLLSSVPALRSCQYSRGYLNRAPRSEGVLCGNLRRSEGWCFPDFLPAKYDFLSEIAGRGQDPGKGHFSEPFRTFLPGNDHDADSEDGMAEKEDCQGRGAEKPSDSGCAWRR